MQRLIDVCKLKIANLEERREALKGNMFAEGLSSWREGKIAGLEYAIAVAERFMANDAVYAVPNRAHDLREEVVMARRHVTLRAYAVPVGEKPVGPW